MHVWRTVCLIYIFIFYSFANQFLSSSFVDYNRKYNQAEEIVYLNYKIRRTQHHKQTNCTWLFISNCNNVSDVLNWTWFLHYFWHFLIISAGIHSTTNLKTYEQSKNFFNPEIQSLSEESLKEKRKRFVGMCSLFTWFNMQILNLCRRWHRCIQNHLERFTKTVNC